MDELRIRIQGNNQEEIINRLRKFLKLAETINNLTFGKIDNNRITFDYQKYISWYD